MSFKVNIPENANRLIHALQNKGYSAYVVGGCVRDSVMGREPHDWDICTSATPAEMLGIFKEYRVIETGLKHGTITVVADGEQYEITTYRIDGKYSDNRRPDSVEFTNDLADDLMRRDFTVNAMAYNDKEGLIDLFCGCSDISDKVIRCVGNPADRFNEDALRIMRAVRFAAQLNFHIEPYTHMAMVELCGNLKNISKERINSELCKIIQSDNAAFHISFNKDIISKFIPEIEDMIGFQQNNPYHDYTVFIHTTEALQHCESTDLITRLAVLFHDIGKPHCYQDGEDGIRHFKGHGKVSAEMTDNIMQRLKFDNDTRHKVTELIHYHDAAFEAGHKYVKRWLNKIGEEQFRRLLDVRRADIKGQKQNYDISRIKELDKIKELLNEVIQDNECFSLKDLAVNGNDLISSGFTTGKRIGEVLNTLLQKVVDGELQNEKATLIKEAEIMLLL